MEGHVEEEGLKHLEHIEQELEEIKERTPAPGHTFIYALLQGAGILLGGIFALSIVGWVLSLLGVIPGFGTIAKSLQDIVAAFRR